MLEKSTQMICSALSRLWFVTGWMPEGMGARGLIEDKDCDCRRARRVSAKDSATSLCALAAMMVASFGLGATAFAQQGTASGSPVVVQPGAPGKPSKTLPPDTPATLPPRSKADVAFMQGMIMHHAQAVEMTALIASHTENKDLRTLGARISSSQSSEIKFMKRWLATRGEPISLEMAGMRGMDASGGAMALMPGMLSAQQMEALREGRRIRSAVSDGNDSASRRCADDGERFVQYGRCGAGRGDFRFRDGRGQYAACRDQDHAVDVGKENA